ncbi:MAG: hypothetical protein ACQERB_15555 [Promethearchaeati archaeon]
MLRIPIENIDYEKSSKTLTIQILDFSYVGLYKKSTKVKTILNDIYEYLKERGLERENISVVAYGNKAISENYKLKNLSKLRKEVAKEEREEEKLSLASTLEEKKPEVKRKRESYRMKKSKAIRDKDMDEEEALLGEMERGAPSPAKAPAAPSAPAGPPAGGRAEADYSMPEVSLAEEIESSEEPSEEETIVYDINAGYQYYSVMMEKKSYLFYVFLSHEELKIMDEEGKVVYETTVRIETKKKEPPVLDLRIEGEGFEMHPLNGKVVVQKDAVNPPVMIFSVMPLKMGKKKKRKELQRRFLNVIIEFEDKIISKTVLGIIVQPKFYRLEIGPINFYLSKKAAYIISILSVLIATGSFIYTIITFGSAPEITDVLSGFFPGLASVIFFGFYLITLAKGLHPLKQKWNNLLNFGKITSIIK